MQFQLPANKGRQKVEVLTESSFLNYHEKVEKSMEVLVSVKWECQKERVVEEARADFLFLLMQ